MAEGESSAGGPVHLLSAQSEIALLVQPAIDVDAPVEGDHTMVAEHHYQGVRTS
jgi:hypothetical protein